MAKVTIKEFHQKLHNLSEDFNNLDVSENTTDDFFFSDEILPKPPKEATHRKVVIIIPKSKKG